jgi:hypothetical protein
MCNQKLIKGNPSTKKTEEKQSSSVIKQTQQHLSISLSLSLSDSHWARKTAVLRESPLSSLFRASVANYREAHFICPEILFF